MYRHFRILFHLFGIKVLAQFRWEWLIPITQKMLGQQLRQVEADRIVVRKAYPHWDKHCDPPWRAS